MPAVSFFRFCEELLARFADDERIMAISGSNFQQGNWRGEATYYFSKYFNPWGWATWRPWSHYDPKMTAWPTFRDAGMLEASCPDPAERTYWTRHFDKTFTGEIDTWDYQFFLTCWMHHGLTASANVNLVSNVGFGDDATHTYRIDSRADLPITEIGALLAPAMGVLRHDG